MSPLMTAASRSISSSKACTAGLSLCLKLNCATNGALRALATCMQWKPLDKNIRSIWSSNVSLDDCCQQIHLFIHCLHCWPIPLLATELCHPLKNFEREMVLGVNCPRKYVSTLLSPDSALTTGLEMFFLTHVVCLCAAFGTVLGHNSSILCWSGMHTISEMGQQEKINCANLTQVTLTVNLCPMRFLAIFLWNDIANADGLSIFLSISLQNHKLMELWVFSHRMSVRTPQIHGGAVTVFVQFGWSWHFQSPDFWQLCSLSESLH